MIVVMHKFAIECGDDLSLYASLHGYRVLLITHDFTDAKTRRSHLQIFENGDIDQEHHSADTRFLPEPLLYIKELAYTLFWGLTKAQKIDRYIALDGLCTIFGNALSYIRPIRKIAFWVIDVVPEKRFTSTFKNLIYTYINKTAYHIADEIWDLSPRMNDIRENALGIYKKDFKHHKLVPYGMWLERIKTVTYADCEQHTLVFMGHMLPKQGAQLIIQALPLIAQHDPMIRLKLIGGGSYLEELKKLAKTLGVEDRCIFFGKVPNIRDVEREIASSCIAYAPYIRALDTWTAYADPGKVKTYLACGVPVILTDAPWNAAEILSRECGLVTSEQVEDIVAKTIQLLDQKSNAHYRKNALDYAQTFSWSALLDHALNT